VETVERVDNRESAEERCHNCRAAHERVTALEGMLRDALGLIRSGPFAF
jgi:hypothetical protein